ncbi:MAG: 4-(cytidine 5'-diphospho)-2-C-methyl-D-erythritol kinase, partial [Sulfurimonas sp.]
SASLEKLMRTHAVQVKKAIPAFAGLGGGSSDAATYLKMCNEVLHLGLSLRELAIIGLKVGADVPFFIYGYDAANVSGIGEVVEEFQEDLLDLETFTPKLELSTPKVYSSYRANFYAPINAEETENFKTANSVDILKTMSANEANDLFAPALKEYQELQQYYQDGWHFSGSGSSFFRVKEK